MMDSNNGFTIFYKYVRKAQVYKSFTNMFARRVFTICSQSAGFTTIFTIFTQMLCSLFLFFFIYNIQGNWVAGSPLFLSLQFFSFALILSASNGSYLYFLLLVAGKFFLFSFGEGRVTGVTFISCHL